LFVSVCAIFLTTPAVLNVLAKVLILGHDAILQKRAGLMGVVASISV